MGFADLHTNLWGRRLEMSGYYEILTLAGMFTVASKTKSAPKAIVEPAGFAQAAECLKTLSRPLQLRIVRLLVHGRYAW